MRNSRCLLLMLGMLWAGALGVDEVKAGAITDFKVTTRGAKVVLEFDAGDAEEGMTLLVNIAATRDLVSVGAGAVEGFDYGVVSLGSGRRMVWNIQDGSESEFAPEPRREVIRIRPHHRTAYYFTPPIFAGF